MILYIAEKPSLGRAIADAIPGSHKKSDGAIELANGDVVSWCIGHLLEQAEPDAYGEQFKKWSRENLPIVPDGWKLVPKTKTRKQLSVLKKWIKKADQLVHAGDPDREGQLLVDEVINYLGVSEKKKAQVKRCLISDLNVPAVKQSLANLRDNREFVPLSVSALARSRADWLYGMNMTRAYTLQGQQCGYQGVLSVGRVQTPLLGLVVRRDADIEQFQPHDYYTVVAHLLTERGERFQAKWQPSEHCQSFLDEQGRNLSRSLAENVVERISQKDAVVSNFLRTSKRRQAPLPHSLSSLQIDANKAFGYSAQKVLDTCQSLYEKHKLITYPRSDSRYLPVGQFGDARAVGKAALENLKASDESKLGQLPLGEVPDQLDYGNRSRAWNDKKVDAHHAIIPTHKSKASLSDAERHIYELVVRNYLAQFMQPESYDEAVAEIAIEHGLFVAKARIVRDPGWTQVFPVKRKNKDDETTTLPLLKKGEALHCERGEVVAKQTTPPKHFTEATLLSAMTGISRYVRDSQLRQVLRDTDGLGTEATRAGIIELLFRRNFLARRGKSIVSTAEGRGLITALPESAVWPDMTAQWESQLEAIYQREQRYQDFMQPLEAGLQGLVMESFQVDMSNLRGLGKSPFKGKRKPKANGKTGRKRTKPRKSAEKEGVH